MMYINDRKFCNRYVIIIHVFFHLFKNLQVSYQFGNKQYRSFDTAVTNTVKSPFKVFLESSGFEHH
jgi:hypothetical protein